MRMLFFLLCLLLLASGYLGVILPSHTLKFFCLPALLLVGFVVFLPPLYQYVGATVMGLFLALFSVLPFLLQPLALIAALLLTRYLYRRFFTNRSFYGMITLVAASVCVYEGSIVMGFLIQRSIFHTDLAEPFFWILWSIPATILLAVALFLASLMLFVSRGQPQPRRFSRLQQW